MESWLQNEEMEDVKAVLIGANGEESELEHTHNTTLALLPRPPQLPHEDFRYFSTIHRQFSWQAARLQTILEVFQVPSVLRFTTCA